MKPGAIGEANLAALIGSSTGSITGLFGIGIAPAVIESDASLVIAYPTVGLFCFIVGGLFGWFVGGILGRRLAKPRRLQQGHVTGGVIGGALPFLASILLGWLLWSL